MELAALFAQQLRVMLYKQFILAKRHYIASIIRLAIPLIGLLAFWLLLRSSVTSFNNGSERVSTPLILPKCIVGEAGRCASMVYSPDVAWSRDVVQLMASQNGLDFGRDFIGSNVSSSDMPYYMLLQLGNMTNGGVYFHRTDGDFIQYEVFYNSSTSSANFFDFSYFSERNNYQKFMHVAVERAIAAKLTGADLAISNMPMPAGASGDSFSTKQFSAMMQLLGLPLFYLGLTATFVNALNGIVAEKHKNLRGYLRTFGLMESVHWLAWFIEATIFYQISLLLFLAFGYANSDFLYFQNSNFFANYFIFTVYGIELVLFAFLTSLVVRTPKAANVAAGIFYVIGMISTLVWALGGKSVYMLYGPESNVVVNIITNVMDVFPFWRMSKCVSDVQTSAVGDLLSIYRSTNTSYYDLSSMNVAYNFSSTYSTGNYPNYIYHSYWFLVPTTSHNLWMMVLLGVIFYVLAWYLDNIIADSFGARRSFIFFAKPSYWGYSAPAVRLDTNIQNVPAMPNTFSRRVDADVDRERGPSTGTGTEILRIMGLCKRFGSKTVVNDLHLQAESGSVVALLGHNGAGKTTTINILTGLTSPSSGTAFIAGYDISKDIDIIRANLGICPQFDVYWTELTAYEHLYILYRLKQRTGMHNIEKLISQKLIDVRLSKVGDHQVGTFSGGMRRRLSVALSTIAEPKLIILDEPTTGIDPANRQYIWRMIKELKHDKLILLTTHSMEEADFLGDKVAIMSNGALQCVGSPLHLKAKYGTGYRVHFTIDPETSDAVKAKITAVAPQMQFISENAGSVVLALPANLDTKHRAQLFDLLQQDTMIKDWGLSNTTLEDVFLRVTRNDQWNHQH